MSTQPTQLDYTPREITPGCFIYEIRNALPEAACSDAIRRFERAREDHVQGRIGQGQAEERSIKRSTDLRISGREEWRDVDEGLFASLQTALVEMAKLHPFFGSNSFRDMGYQIQRTAPGEYYHWHVDSGPGEFSQRQLVAIWYLNDVPGPGGETEFHFQNIKIKPETGKLVLFPPFWTHAHRGVTLERGLKYIATTWLCFT